MNLKTNKILFETRGLKTFRKEKLWCFQLYWPEIMASKYKSYIVASTCIMSNFHFANDAFQIGFQLFGFGFGVQYDRNYKK